MTISNTSNTPETAHWVVHPTFSGWQELVPQLLVSIPILLWCVIVYHHIPTIVPVGLLLLHGSGIVGYLFWKKALVQQTTYTFYETYCTLQTGSVWLKPAETAVLPYTEMGTVKYTHTQWETAQGLGTIAVKKPIKQWLHYFTSEYGHQRILLYPWFLRPYLSMLPYYTLIPSQKRVYLEFANIPNSKEIYQFMADKIASTQKGINTPIATE
jgi:hypothetical protein